MTFQLVLKLSKLCFLCFQSLNVRKCHIKVSALIILENAKVSIQWLIKKKKVQDFKILPFSVLFLRALNFFLIPLN